MVVDDHNAVVDDPIDRQRAKVVLDIEADRKSLKHFQNRIAALKCEPYSEVLDSLAFCEASLEIVSTQVELLETIRAAYDTHIAPGKDVSVFAEFVHLQLERYDALQRMFRSMFRYVDSVEDWNNRSECFDPENEVEGYDTDHIDRPVMTIEEYIEWISHPLYVLGRQTN